MALPAASLRGRILDVADRELLGLATLDLATALVLVLANLATVVAGPWTGTSAWFVGIATSIGAGSVALRRRSPQSMVVAFVASIVVTSFLPDPQTPLPLFVALLLLCFSVAVYAPRRRVVPLLLVVLAGCYLLQARSDPILSEVLLSPPALVALPALAGRTLRRSRDMGAQLSLLTDELRRERAANERTAVLAERQRIAREIHDVVAHSVSVMVVQAGTADELFDLDAVAAHDAVRTIRTSGKEALNELRRLLVILRSHEGETGRPQPGLADLDRLVDDAQLAGAQVTVRVVGTPRPLPAGVSLAAYRIVQEGLTNARRHAGLAPVEVQLCWEPAALGLTVRDQGPGASAADPGHGLLGVKERAELYGGEAEAGPRSDGPGWVLQARLPLPARLEPRDATRVIVGSDEA